MTIRRPSSPANPPAAKQSWRKGSAAKPTSEKLWSSQASQSDVWLTRSFKLFVALGLLLATTGGVIAYLTRTDNKASMLVVAIDDYRYPWAPNAWAQEDADWFEDRLDTQVKKLNVILADALPEQKSIDEWLSFQLESYDFVAGGPGGSVIWRSYGTAIIYLSAHFAVDQQGQPCVMTPTASSTDAWQAAAPVRLQKVLDTISSHAKLQPSPLRGIRKLVVLDLGKQPPSMTLGRCNDGLHTSIQQVIESQTDRNMAVILSCGDGQRAWTAPEFGGSNFGLWFAQGLSGAADKNRNGRVGLQEIVEYLKGQVNRFANRRRAAFQEPVCFFPSGNAIDFDLAFAQATDPLETPRTSTANSIAAKVSYDLDKHWAEFESWRESQLGYDPWHVSEVLGRLIRADQLLLAGPSHEGQLLEELAKLAELMGPSPTWPISIIGQSRAGYIENDWANLAIDIKQPMLDWLEQVTVDGKAPEKPPAVSEEQAHLAAWSWLSSKQTGLDVASVQRVRRLQAEAIPDSLISVPSRDRVLLQSLVERLDWPIENSKLGDPRLTADRLKWMLKILEAHRQLESIVDIRDPRLSNWLVKQKELLQNYLMAVDYWFVGSADALVECERWLGPLFGDLVDGRTSRMKQALDERKQLEADWKLHDELVTSLPRLLWVVDHQSSLFADQRRRLRELLPKLAEGLQALHASLESLSDNAWSPSDKLRANWDEVERYFFSSLMKLVAENEVDAASCRDILLWLEQPIATRSETRSKLRQALIEHLQSDAKDWNTNAAESPSVAFEFPTLDSFDENPSLDLLRAILSSDWQLDEKNSSLDSRYSQLQQRVREASLAQLQNAPPAFDMEFLIKQAWQAQVVAAWLAQAPVASPSMKSDCPTRARWASAAQLTLLAMADFAREDFWVLPSDAKSDPSNQYFAKLAQNWMAAAGTKAFAEGKLSREIFKERESLLQKSTIASSSWKDDLWSELPKQPLEGTSVSLTITQPSKHQPLGVAMLEHPGASKPEAVTNDKPTLIKMDLGLVTSSATMLRASFRGRATEHNLLIKRPTAELQLVWNVLKTDATKIRVSADQTDRQVLFVLDCSNSLGQATLKKAKTTLLSILDRLPMDTEVGLVAFGHSASWVQPKSFNVDFNLPFFQREGRQPNNLQPNRTPENDVDLLVPFEKLSAQCVARFKDKLNSLEPFGFTPLYYAMQFSLDYQQRMRRGVKQNLVVITDGNNNVTKGDGGAELGLPLRNEFLISKEKIKAEIDRLRSSLQLDVIAYQFDQTSNSRELEELAGPRHFHRATDRENELLSVVRKILGLRSFSVRVDGEIATQTDFGLSKTIRTGQASRVQLAVQDTPTSVDFVAMGGEFLDAKFDADRNQLRFMELREQFKDACQLEIEGRALSIGTLVGARKGNTRYIRAAIQSSDPQQPSVRPRRLWVELDVRSTDTANSKLSIGLSDVEWETDSLAPVFRVPILHGLPERLRVWLAFDESEVALSLPYTQWESRGGREFPEVEPPIGEPEGNGWTLSFAQPVASRLAWSLDPSPDARIEYSLGKTQRQKYWYRNQPPDDVEIHIEKMPAIDRPNTGGWSTSEWLAIPSD